MAWVKFENLKIVGYAAIAPPTAEEDWVERAEDDPSVVEFFNPQPQIQANWGQFRAQVLSHSAYFRIIGAHPQNHILNVPLVWALGEVGKNPPIIAEVQNLWGAIAYNAAPTAEEIASLNAIAQACAMPFHLNEQGMMVSP